MTEFEQTDDRGRLMELLTGAEPVAEDYLPAGPGVSAEEVGERGPWYGYHFPDGTVEGWARNRAMFADSQTMHAIANMRRV